MRTVSFVVLMFAFVSLIPLANADSNNSINSADEVTDGYEDYWWVCYDDDCTEGPSWENGVDQLDWYKIKTYPGDKVNWEIYNRVDPHYAWLGAQFFDSSGNVVNIQEDSDSDSRADYMWIKDFERDSRTIAWSGGSCNGYWTYMRVHAEDDMGGDGTTYDLIVDVDTSGRTCSSNSGNTGNDNTQNDNTQNDNTDSTTCPYRSGKIATNVDGNCIYIDAPSFQPNQQTSSSSGIDSAAAGKAVFLVVVFVIFLIVSITKSVSRRRARRFQMSPVPLTETSSNSFSDQATDYFNPEPLGYTTQYHPSIESVQYGMNGYETQPLQDLNVQNQQINQPIYSGYGGSSIPEPSQAFTPPPTMPPRSIPTGPSVELNGEFDDNGYEWLQWNANSRWYWRFDGDGEWQPFDE